MCVKLIYLKIEKEHIEKKKLNKKIRERKVLILIPKKIRNKKKGIAFNSFIISNNYAKILEK